jgi:hypothetical protein
MLRLQRVNVAEERRAREGERRREVEKRQTEVRTVWRP